MKFNEALTYYREKYNFSKSDLARKLEVHNTYVFGLEKGRFRPPSEKRLIQISKALNLLHEEEDHLMRLAFQERITDKVPVGFQKFLENSGHSSVASDTPSPAPMVAWSFLYQHKTKEGDMYWIKMGDSVNAPEIRLNDTLCIKETKDIEQGKYYLLKDLKAKKVIIRQLNRYSEAFYMNTGGINRMEEEFNPKKHEIMGQVIDLIRKI